MTQNVASHNAVEQTSFADWMHAVQIRMESAMGRLLPADEAIPARLHQAMRYASLGGGKRVTHDLVLGGLDDLACAWHQSSTLRVPRTTTLGSPPVHVL